MIRHPGATEKIWGRSRWRSSRRSARLPTVPFLQQIDFDRELADLALDLRDLALVLDDSGRFGQFVGEFSRLILSRRYDAISLRRRLSVFTSACVEP
jgi:hypothetical protein